MFLADKADQEASKEETKLRDMQRAPFHSEEALFDSRVNQRRLWMAKNEVALQVIFHDNSLSTVLTWSEIRFVIAMHIFVDRAATRYAGISKVNYTIITP